MRKPPTNWFAQVFCNKNAFDKPRLQPFTGMCAVATVASSGGLNRLFRHLMTNCHIAQRLRDLLLATGRTSVIPRMGQTREMHRPAKDQHTTAAHVFPQAKPVAP